MNDNLAIWNKLAEPPQAALKKIVGGRMAGKSDINPQWRMRIMTETFGSVGIGWKYSIDRLWTENGSDGQVCAFALVSVSVKQGDTWSEPIPGSGGSMLIAKEKNGMFTSDEAFKMATTDALSVALKAFGVAANVYLGVFDGAKYPTQEKPAEKPELTPANEKAWSRAIDVYAEKQSFDAIEKHMRISDENKEAIKKAAMAEV